MLGDQLVLVSQLDNQAVELHPLVEGVAAAGADKSALAEELPLAADELALAEESPLAAALSLAGRCLVPGTQRG